MFTLSWFFIEYDINVKKSLFYLLRSNSFLIWFMSENFNMWTENAFAGPFLIYQWHYG